MVTMTSLEGQAWFRIANHLAGNPITAAVSNFGGAS